MAIKLTEKKTKIVETAINMLQQRMLANQMIKRANQSKNLSELCQSLEK